MKKYLPLLFFALYFNTGNLYGQDIDELFHSINTPKGWEKSMDKDTSFYAFYKHGKIAIISLTNESRIIELTVFDKAVLEDPFFLKSCDENDSSSSCRHFGTDNRFRIFPFLSSQYYIIPNLCPKCDFIKDQKCKRIKKSFHKWADKWAHY